MGVMNARQNVKLYKEATESDRTIVDKAVWKYLFVEITLHTHTHTNRDSV